MLYDKLPRPVTSPDARERARALLGAAQRRQNLFAQALSQTEATPEPAGAPTQRIELPSTDAGGSLDALVRHVAQANDHDLVDTHRKLAQARALSQQHMAGDAELTALNAAAYGSHANPAKPQTNADVVDVTAHEVVPTPTLPPRPGHAPDRTAD